MKTSHDFWAKYTEILNACLDLDESDRIPLYEQLRQFEGAPGWVNLSNEALDRILTAMLQEKQSEETSSYEEESSYSY